MKRKEMLQGSLPLYSTKIALSVVDNVLVIHQVDAKVVMLEDIFADSRTRVSAPLPLLIRGLPRGTNVPSSAESSEASTLSNDTSAANLYSDDWSFLVPDLVCDVATGFLWKIKLDLEAISASSSEVPWVLEFLQRRKLEANKAKHLCVELLGSIVIERRPLPVIFRAVNVLVSSFAYSLKTGSYSKSGKPRAENSNNQDTTVKTQASSDSEGNANSSNGENLMASEEQQLNGSGSESQVTSAAIPPDELHTCVFASVEEEMTGDASYLFAIILEFIRSANMEKIKVHPNVYVLAVRLLGRNCRYAELGQFILNKAISASSSEVTWVLEFLQRRKLEANKAKHLCVELLGSIVIERRPLPVIFRAVNVLVSSFAYSLKIGSYSKSGKPRAENSNNQDTTVKTQASSDSEGNAISSNGENLMASEDQLLNGSGSESQVTSAAIPPDELHTCVFASVEEEMTGDASYLFAIILEFIRSANMDKIKVHPNVYVLAVRLLGRNRRYAELGQFILNKLLRDDLKSNQEQLVAVLNLLMHCCRNGLSEFLQRFEP